jgi:hypothetical protein
MLLQAIASIYRKKAPDITFIVQFTSFINRITALLIYSRCRMSLTSSIYIKPISDLTPEVVQPSLQKNLLDFIYLLTSLGVNGDLSHDPFPETVQTEYLKLTCSEFDPFLTGGREDAPKNLRFLFPQKQLIDFLGQLYKAAIHSLTFRGYHQSESAEFLVSFLLHYNVEVVIEGKSFNCKQKVATQDPAVQNGVKQGSAEYPFTNAAWLAQQGYPAIGEILAYKPKMEKPKPRTFFR